MSESEKPKSGWGWPLNSKKAHWFENGHVVSICGKWMYSGALSGSADKYNPREDCSVCIRRITPKEEKAK